MQKYPDHPVVLIYTIGCVENQLDGARMERFFQANGWRLTDRAAAADLILVNSCGYTDTLEKNSLAAVEQLKTEAKPGVPVHLVGCLAAIRPDVTGPDNGIKVIPRHLSALNGLIDARVPIEEVEANTLPPDEEHIDRFRAAMIHLGRAVGAMERALPFPLPRALRQFRYITDERSYYIKISVGCLGKCSFCAVRKAKGKLLSREPERILRDFDHGLSEGYRDFVLSADEVGSYGRDRGTTLAELLREFLQRPGGYRILLRNVDPEWLIAGLDDLIPLFQSGRFPYLVSPLQAGSPEVLKAMDRGYTLEAAAAALARLRREVPEMILRTHFIVGFPGETEEHFRQTMDYIRRLPIDHFKVHEFSPRPHTRAALLPNPIPPEVIHARANRLRLLELKIFLRSLFS